MIFNIDIKSKPIRVRQRWRTNRLGILRDRYIVWYWSERSRRYNFVGNYHPLSESGHKLDELLTSAWNHYERRKIGN